MQVNPHDNLDQFFSQGTNFCDSNPQTGQFNEPHSLLCSQRLDHDQFNSHYLDSDFKHQMSVLLEDQQPAIIEESSDHLISKTLSCKCTRSKCLKLYCVCFHNNELCNSKCGCENCQNNEDNQQLRQKMIKFAIKKRLNPKPSLFDTSTVEGCNCLQTKCMKNYCECFVRGKQCTPTCQCYKCKNGNPKSLQKKPRRRSRTTFRLTLT